MDIRNITQIDEQFLYSFIFSDILLENKLSIIEDVSQTLIKRINNFQYIYFL